MTSQRRGYRRDNDILQAIEQHKALNTEQIRIMFFSGIKNDRVMAQRRLKKLFDNKRVQRDRLAVFEPAYYYIGKRPGQPEHLLSTNWIYLYLKKHLKSWEELEIDYEIDFKILRTDAIVTVRNTVTGKVKLVFIEVDLSSNTFNKVSLYNDLYDSGKLLTTKWGKNLDRFPLILIVTADRFKEIQKVIKRDNTNGLEFKVLGLDKIVWEVMNNEKDSIHTGMVNANT